MDSARWFCAITRMCVYFINLQISIMGAPRASAHSLPSQAVRQFSAPGMSNPLGAFISKVGYIFLRHFLLRVTELKKNVSGVYQLVLGHHAVRESICTH